MNVKVTLLFLFSLLALTHCERRQLRQLYYLVEQDFQDKPNHLEDLESHPENIPVQVINCKKFNHKCQKFKIRQPFPLLIFWSGPGTGFRSLGSPSKLAFNDFLSRTQSHPIYPLRNFLEKLSFIEFMILAAVAMQIFYMIFSALFKDRSGLSNVQNKQKAQ